MQIIDVLKGCANCSRRVPVDNASGPIYRGRIVVTRAPQKHGLNKKEAELLSSSERRGSAGLNADNLTSSLKTTEPGIVAMFLRTGLKETGYWNRDRGPFGVSAGCQGCPNRANLEKI